MKIFLNLTNGIEYLDSGFDGYGEFNKVSFVRIQSTTIERKKWVKLFADLDHNFLINLALGEVCCLVDGGARKKYSKTLYYGVPLITYILNRLWYNIEDPYRFSKGNINNKIFDVKDYYNHVYEELFKFNSTKEKERVKEKLKYYIKFLAGNRVSLIPMGFSTCHDGDFRYYRDILRARHETKNTKNMGDIEASNEDLSITQGLFA